jgi:hypothetical protein
MNIETNQHKKTVVSTSVRSEKHLRRKQRGNTLVPVIISLAIAAIATVAFLNQGATLTNQNRVNLAANEITGMLYDWSVMRASNTAIDIGANRPAAMAAENVFGIANEYTAAAAPANGAAGNSASVLYRTDTDANCLTVAAMFPVGSEGLSSAATCGGNGMTLNLL